jgi:hypothetical protein
LAVICVLTHRQLEPGTYEQFREAWRPGEWWPHFTHGYHLRSADDPDQIISFAFYDATIEEFDEMRDDPHWMADEDRRLQRIQPFEQSAKLGGVYEVAEEIRV